jgi:hypothetical protein
MCREKPRAKQRFASMDADGDQAEQRSFSLEKGQTDPRNEGTVTGHFRTEKGRDTRAAPDEIPPAIIREGIERRAPTLLSPLQS